MMKTHNLKKVTALTKHNKAYFYIDGKRVGREYFAWIYNSGRNAAVKVDVKGDKVTETTLLAM